MSDKSESVNERTHVD